MLLFVILSNTMARKSLSNPNAVLKDIYAGNISISDSEKKEKVSVFLWGALEKKVNVNVRGKKEGELTEKVILIMIH